MAYKEGDYYNIMTYKQMTDKLAANHLVQAIDEDLARLVWLSMAGSKSKSINDQKKSLTNFCLDGIVF